jgi:hypothetical protein
MSFTQPKEEKKLEEALVRQFQGGDLEAYDNILILYTTNSFLGYYLFFLNKILTLSTWRI